jgi:2-keto-4-pentenoate hydratase
VGWKVGAGDRECLGDGIVVGHLTSATVLAPGAVYRAGAAAALHADAEVALCIGRDGEIDGYAAALELVDLADGDDADEIVAANVFHRAVAFGPWHAAVPGDATAALVVDEVSVARAAVRSDHREKAQAVAALLDAVGEELRAGDRVITGSVVQVPVAPGAHVVADFGALGRVALDIASPG